MTKFLTSLLLGLLLILCPVQAAGSGRTTDGLQALYLFDSIDDGTIRDKSGTDPAVNLTIRNRDAVELVGDEGDRSLRIKRPTLLQAAAGAKQLQESIRKSGELTAEVWLTPADTKQAGPARILTFSQNSGARNFTMGQEGDRYDVRLRTTKTSTNGIPSVATDSGTVQQKPTHVVYTFAQRTGTATIYINGRSVVAKKMGGNLNRWDTGFQFAIGDEVSGDRAWLGQLHLVAVYNRALSAAEARRNYDAGPAGKLSPAQLAARERQAAERHFETAIAPLLARHCLECHDSANHAGGLDLSKKVAAFKGSENGAVLVPSKSAESSLWASVESESMPLERPPLTADEKKLLQQWIDDGATWSLSEIDPAIYLHGGGSERFVQRLTVDEYIETVRHTLGVDIAQEARERLPKDLRADGFSNTSYNLNVDLKHVNAYAQLADSIVRKMDVEQFVSRFSKRRRFTDDDMGEVIEKLGYHVLRGPLDDREVIGFRGITTAVAGAGGTFEEAISLVLQAMIQSPRFIYRIENQPASGTAAPVGQYELANRLSYILWGGPPDEALMQAAANRELHGDDLLQHAERMLQHPRARQQSQRFASDWLNLNRLNNLQPNAKRFPTWNAKLADDMKAETLAYFDEVVWQQQQPMSALLDAQVTFATPQLAKFYGLPLDQQAAADQLHRIDLSKIDGRGGLLTQGSLLTIGGDNASMVTRGLLVMHEFLRGVVKDPPPCVDTTPVPTKPGLTQRAIAMSRIANANCGGCHGKFEPLAFGLEKFDGLGAYHEADEHGNKLRDDGELLIPGSAEPVKYNSSAELMKLLAASERVSQSFTWKIAQFALGRPLVAEDAAIVDKIHQQAKADGGTWHAILKAIVTSDLVTKSRTADARHL